MKVYIVTNNDNHDTLVAEAKLEEIKESMQKLERVKIYRSEDVKNDSSILAKVLVHFGTNALNEILNNKAILVEINIVNAENRRNGKSGIMKKLVKSLAFRRKLL